MVFVMTALCSSAMAQMKIALIDVQRCVTESDAGRKVQAEMRKMEQERTPQLKAKRDEIEKLQKDFLDKEKALSETAKNKLLEELQSKSAELDNALRQYNAEMQKKDVDSAKKIAQELESVIAAVAKADKYDLVLLSPAVAYAPSAVDITQKVIEQYNKQQPK